MPKCNGIGKTENDNAKFNQICPKVVAFRFMVMFCGPSYEIICNTCIIA